LPLSTDFKGFFTFRILRILSFYGPVCPPGHSFLRETGYNYTQRFEIARRDQRFGAKAGD